MAADEYKYVFQGLIIPQTVTWKHLKEDGSDLDKDNDVYVEIKYNIDGEAFRAIYNLADIFTSNIHFKDSKGHTAYRTWNPDVDIYMDNSSKFYTKDSETALADGVVIMYDGTNYYKANGTTQIYKGTDNEFYSDAACTSGNKLSTQPSYFLKIEKGAMVPVMLSDVDGMEDLNFNEGWQNTLNIIISPVAILFDADVYEWVTDKEADVTVQ